VVQFCILSYIRIPVLKQSKNFLGDWGGRGPRGPPLNTPMGGDIPIDVPQPKYWRGCVPGIPGGVNASASGPLKPVGPCALHMLHNPLLRHCTRHMSLITAALLLPVRWCKFLVTDYVTKNKQFSLVTCFFFVLKINKIKENKNTD